jgi:hypothetical protein
LSSSKFAAFKDDAIETWLERFPLTVKLEDADLLRLEDAVRRMLPVPIPPATLLAQGLTMPRAKHITKARLLEVLVADFPEDLLTRMVEAGSSTTDSTASSKSSLTWLTSLSSADSSGIASSFSATDEACGALGAAMDLV